MPYFKGDFTTEQLHIMRKAASECAVILNARGDVEKERDIAVAIIEAANAGCWKHEDLVATVTAAIRGPGL